MTCFRTVGFIATKFSLPDERVLASRDRQGTDEQKDKESAIALGWMRLSNRMAFPLMADSVGGTLVQSNANG